MLSPQSFDVLTIGHSSQPIDRFLALLRDADVTALADVRSTPSSRRFPWFSAKPLQARLEAEGIAYLPMGDALGGRPRDPSLFRDGVADYEAMAATPEFHAGLARVIETMRQHRVCLMCAERDPLDCHRCLLVAPPLAVRGLAIGHVLGDGSVISHRTIEDGLLAGAASDDLFAGGRSERLAQAYRRRAHKVAFRLPR
jgi:uncharacterized protein (DUF488 family)